MKTGHLLLIPLLCLPTVLAAGDYHTFRDPDMTREFEARITGFDAESGRVSVVMRDGRRGAFGLDSISEEDQKVVRDTAVDLAVASRLDVRPSERTERGERGEEGNFFVVPVTAGFDIEVTNRNENPVEGVEIRYRVYFSRAVRGTNERTGRAEVNHVQEHIEGNETLSSLAFGQRVTVETTDVDLREMRQKPLSQCTGGG